MYFFRNYVFRRILFICWGICFFFILIWRLACSHCPETDDPSFLINYFSLLYLILSFIFRSNPSKAELKREREEKEERELREKEERELREIREEKERLKREKELVVLRKKKEFWFELSGLDTEKELNKVFKQLGYKTKLTPRSNDEGIDHVLDKNIVVQTKNQKKKVSRPDLQKFWGSWKDSHKKGIFVSIHGFAKTCKEFVKDKPILLYDVNHVVRMSEGKKPEWNE